VIGKIPDKEKEIGGLLIYLNQGVFYWQTGKTALKGNFAWLDKRAAIGYG
jgi:hypothetical protein